MDPSIMSASQTMLEFLSTQVMRVHSFMTMTYRCFESFLAVLGGRKIRFAIPGALR